MKKIILIILICFPLSIKAQYLKLVFGPITYTVECYNNQKGQITFELPLFSPDNEKISMLLGSEKSRERFKSRLINAKLKFIEWDSTCIKNKISDISKEIKFNGSLMERPLIKFDKYFDSVKPSCIYVRNNNTSYIMVCTGNLKSSTNNFITSKGGFIAMYSSEEIQRLIDALDEKAISDYVASKNNINSLLK